MRMGQGVRTGLGHGGITCVLQTPFSSYVMCLLGTCQSTLERDSREKIVTAFVKLLEQVIDMTSMTY